MDGVSKEKEETVLPPGFRFHPTDEELVAYYLTHKISDTNFSARAIAHVDLNKCEPWDLPGIYLNPLLSLYRTGFWNFNSTYNPLWSLEYLEYIFHKFFQAFLIIYRVYHSVCDIPHTQSVPVLFRYQICDLVGPFTV